jgi:hypothetical protein
MTRDLQVSPGSPHRPAFLVLISCYLILALCTLISWHTNHRFGVTGDEPHYLVMTRGIIRHKTFDQTPAYRDEFRQRRIYPLGLAPPDATPGPENTHAVWGPHGLYNAHNIGLPILLIPAYGIGRILGAKIFLILLSSVALLVCWKVACLFTANKSIQCLAVAGVFFSPLVIPAASQIYPDLLGGEIVLGGAYWLLTIRSSRPVWLKLVGAIAIAYLPWIMIKFAVATLILIALIAWLTWQETRKPSELALITVPTFLSLFLLAIYNHYAFGNFLGPIAPGALYMDVSARSIMYILGIHLDQNQGFLAQNPILCIGVLFLPWLWRIDWRVGLAITLVYLSLVVPNGLNANRYGGFSFSGRYAWSGSLLLTIPAILGLTRIAQYSKNLFRIIVAANLLLQGYFYYLYTFTDFPFFNRIIPSIPPSLYAYATFYRPISRWLPAFYDPAWAYHYLPNLVSILFLTGLLLIGIFAAIRGSWPRKVLLTFLGLTGAAMIAAGASTKAPIPLVMLAPSLLPRHTQRLPDS